VRACAQKAQEAAAAAARVLLVLASLTSSHTLRARAHHRAESTHTRPPTRSHARRGALAITWMIWRSDHRCRRRCRHHPRPPRARNLPLNPPPCNTHTHTHMHTHPHTHRRQGGDQGAGGARRAARRRQEEPQQPKGQRRGEERRRGRQVHVGQGGARRRGARCMGEGLGLGWGLVGGLCMGAGGWGTCGAGVQGAPMLPDSTPMHTPMQPNPTTRTPMQPQSTHPCNPIQPLPRAPPVLLCRPGGRQPRPQRSQLRL